jgi:hypothetical protein
MSSGPLARYAELRAHQRTSYIHFFYEATVGAGLPVIATLQHLIASGDRVDRVEGIFSGTLSYIFNNFRPGEITLSSPLATPAPHCRGAWLPLPGPRPSVGWRERLTPAPARPPLVAPQAARRSARWWRRLAPLGTPSLTRATTWAAWTWRAR